MKIVVYSGRGICQVSALFANKWLSNLFGIHVVNSPNIKKSDILCIPGGSGGDVMKGINTDISEFVHNGGTYLGICCGAYIACDNINFEEKGIKRGLGLVRLTSTGPMYKYDNTPFDFNDERNTKITSISDVFTAQEFNAYYHGGGTFDCDGGIHPCNGAFADVTQYKMLRTYDKTAFVIEALYENKCPAVISCRLGNGLVILSGVHPEHEDSNVDPLFRRIFASYAIPIE